MKRTLPARLGVVLVAITLLAATAGCIPLRLGPNTASFLTGWVLGGAATALTVDRQCYQNGVLIDCATLPANLGE